MKTLIDTLRDTHTLHAGEYKQLLLCSDLKILEYLRQQAQTATRLHWGTRILMRGLIETSNCCRNDCFYCGIRKSNTKLKRYRMTPEQIMNCCSQGYEAGLRTFVLQSGEEPGKEDTRIEELIGRIRQQYPDVAITLSLGERPREVYERFFRAGANRYLLRHETHNAGHYRRLHPQEMSRENRLRCLNTLKEIGYQTGTGILVGSPYQEIDHLVEDLLFIEAFQPEMIGVGPFIPHSDTPFGRFKTGSTELVLRLLSIFRLMHPGAWMPSTTALASLTPDGSEKGILAGANVLMPKLTPRTLQEKYKLYNHAPLTETSAKEACEILRHKMEVIGYTVSGERGESIKKNI